MNTHRTVGWLVILMIITPFLAIPEWLLQTAITILGLAAVGAMWLTGSQTIDQPQQEPSSSDHVKDQSNTNTPKESQPDSGEDQSGSQQPLDIEDPESDTMMAAERWRRRASRDIS
jgi:hypothetical protein